MALAALRARVAGAAARVPPEDAYWASDGALERTLAARGGDVEKAAVMYERIVAFRAERQCWRLLDGAFYRPPEVLSRFMGWGFLGLDKEGFPVYIERVGANDLLALHEAAGTPAFLSYVCYLHEAQERAMRATSAARGADRHKLTVIVDLAGYQLAGPATLRVFFERTRLEEDHYPEIVRKIIIINAPSLFASVWSLVERFVDEGTRAKIQIVGAAFLPTLLKYMDAAVVPAALGGSLAPGGDALCRALVAGGGPLPLAFRVGVAADGDGVGEEVTLAAGATSAVHVLLPAGATLAWRWGVAEKDVALRVDACVGGAAAGASSFVDATALVAAVYGIHRLAVTAGSPPAWPPAGAGAPTLVHPAARAKRGEGRYEAPPGGALVRLLWDNASSWMTAKTVARRIDVLVGDCGAGASRAEDPEAVLAEERARARAAFGVT